MSATIHSLISGPSLSNRSLNCLCLVSLASRMVIVLPCSLSVGSSEYSASPSSSSMTSSRSSFLSVA